MKKIIIIVFLTLSFFSRSLTSEISDYEIEGISVGDSLLVFFEESEIKKNFFSVSDAVTGVTGATITARGAWAVYRGLHWRCFSLIAKTR